MSFTIDHPIAPAPASTGWSSPAANLWVANRDGEYGGMVEFNDGRFVARDRFGNVVAVCSNKLTAQNNVNSASENPAPALRRFTNRYLHRDSFSARAMVRRHTQYRRSV